MKLLLDRALTELSDIPLLLFGAYLFNKLRVRSMKVSSWVPLFYMKLGRFYSILSSLGMPTSIK